MASYKKHYFLLVLLAVVQMAINSTVPLHIMVILPEPENSGTANSPLSYQPQKVLSSAKQAVLEINNCTKVLDGFHMEIIPIQSSRMNSYHGLIQFYNHLLSRRDSLIGVVGVVSKKQDQVLLQVAGHPGIDLVQLVDPVVPLDGNYPHTFTPYPSLAFHMEAAVQIVLHLQWNRVGLIYNSTSDDPVYLRAARTFVALIEQANSDIELVHIDVSLNVVLESSKSLAFLSLLPFAMSIELISTSQDRGLKYAWILVDTHVWKFSEILHKNVLLIRSTEVDNYLDTNQIPSCSSESNVKNEFVYRTTWELCLSLNLSQQFLKGFQRERLTKAVESQLAKTITHSINKLFRIYTTNKTLVGYFDAHTKKFSMNLTIDIPGLGPNIAYTDILFPPAVTYCTTAITAACYLFTTIILVLFIYYRDQPEIKASTFSLSLCTLLGCYLIISGALHSFIISGKFISSRTNRILACSYLFLVSPGIDLMLTTVLAKVLRIWRVFTLFGRTGKAWKDSSLLVFIGIVVGVKIALHVLWTIVDPYTLTDVIKVDTVRVRYEVAQQCESRHNILWVSLMYGFSVIMGLVLIGASIVTRKIKQENFKDTKKISVFVTSIIYIAFVGAFLWWIMRLISNIVGSKILNGIVYCMIAFLSEVFLFMPKIIPPILRRFSHSQSPRVRKLFSSS